MKRIAWLTDVHLNFLREDLLRQFLVAVADQTPDAIILSGDIAEAPTVVSYLRRMEDAWRRPIYFVLGNHDFYGGSIVRTRVDVARVAQESEFLVYLTACGAVELTPETTLVGHDGWGDTRLGNYAASDVLLTDFFAIEELRQPNRDPHELDMVVLRQELERLGDEAGRHFARVLSEAMARRRRVIAVTHVPPFRGAAWYEGRPSNDNWLPFFSCKAAGDAMLQAAASHPDRELLVLCGHTHGGGHCQIAPNLRVLTGEARYGQPKVEVVLDVE